MLYLNVLCQLLTSFYDTLIQGIKCSSKLKIFFFVWDCVFCLLKVERVEQ